VLHGHAGPGLLETYDAERRPVAEFTVEQAYTRYVQRLDPGLGADDLMPIVEEATVELGYRYHSDAVIAEPGEDGSLWENPHEPTARPGSRAPHLALPDTGTGVTSTLDLASRGFALLAGANGQAWCDAAQAAGAELGISIETRRMTGVPGFEELYGIGSDGAVLLRPDAFVAWRAVSAPTHGKATLHAVLETILDRSHAAA
jgi:putative polyketide hydroxylase